MSNGCNKELKERKECIGTSNCPTAPVSTYNSRNPPDEENVPDDDTSKEGEGEGDGDEDIEDDPECELSEWNQDDCSCEDGQGDKFMRREFKKNRNKKSCMRKYQNVKLKKPCEESDCHDGSTTMKVRFF